MTSHQVYKKTYRQTNKCKYEMLLNCNQLSKEAKNRSKRRQKQILKIPDNFEHNERENESKLLIKLINRVAKA